MSTPDPSSQPPSVPAPSAEEVALCDGLLASGRVKAERLPPIGSAEGCSVALPVKLSAISLANGSLVSVEPPVTIRCGLADALADWLRLDLGPLLAAKGGGVSKLSGVGGYECRGRNRVAGAKLSEHASGNAIDISAFGFVDKSLAKLAAVAQADRMFAQVKLTACARFMTVLGPGSDGYHQDHLHLDLEVRRHGHHLCQWQLP